MNDLFGQSRGAAHRRRVEGPEQHITISLISKWMLIAEGMDAGLTPELLDKALARREHRGWSCMLVGRYPVGAAAPAALVQ